MGTSATKAKRKWNKENYTPVTTALKPEMASELKAHCRERGLSVSGVITGLISEYLGRETAAVANAKEKKKKSDTRGGRNRELWAHIKSIESILEGEERYLDNIPENLRGGERYERASESVEHLQSGLEELREVYPERRK